MKLKSHLSPLSHESTTTLYARTPLANYYQKLNIFGSSPNFVNSIPMSNLALLEKLAFHHLAGSSSPNLLMPIMSL